MTATGTEFSGAPPSAHTGRATPGPYDAVPTPRGPSWWEFAACRTADADLFCVPDGVPLRRKRERERRAKAICATCPVRARCLDEALARDEQFGVWGGKDARERRELRRRLAS
ncbi:WhiB family transcriptional regulator [Haloactinopolyspora alba]|nr:WhiB family transcriptional regulator [Haloactinopolyspora alba]